jgi:hypothetical protein
LAKFGAFDEGESDCSLMVELEAATEGNEVYTICEGGVGANRGTVGTKTEETCCS